MISVQQATSNKIVKIYFFHLKHVETLAISNFKLVELHLFLLIFFLEVNYSWLSTCFSILVIFLLNNNNVVMHTLHGLFSARIH